MTGNIQCPECEDLKRKASAREAHNQQLRMQLRVANKRIRELDAENSALTKRLVEVGQ